MLRLLCVNIIPAGVTCMVPQARRSDGNLGELLTEEHIEHAKQAPAIAWSLPAAAPTPRRSEDLIWQQNTASQRQAAYIDVSSDKFQVRPLFSYCTGRRCASLVKVGCRYPESRAGRASCWQVPRPATIRK